MPQEIDENDILKLVDKHLLDRLTSTDNLLYENIGVLRQLKDALTGVPITVKPKIVAPTLSMLPLLEGWSYDAIDDTTITVNAGEDRLIYDVDLPGWVYYAGVLTIDPTVSVGTIVYDAYDRSTRIDVSASDLHTFGNISPNPFGFYCSRYDTANYVYAISYYPTNPVAFKRKYSLYVKNPTASATPVVYSLTTIIIHDEDAFKKSMAEVNK